MMLNSLLQLVRARFLVGERRHFRRHAGTVVKRYDATSLQGGLVDDNDPKI